MAIDKYLDKMEDLLADAMPIPLVNGKKLVDTDRLLELLDAIRMNIPDEIKEAKNIVADRNNIMDAANEQAETIIKKAENRAKQLISQEEVTKAAKKAADELMTETNQKAREVENAATEYALNALKKSADAMQSVLSEVQNTALSFRKRVNVNSDKKDGNK